MTMQAKEFKPWVIVAEKEIDGPGNTSKVKIIVTRRAIGNGFHRYNLSIENNFLIQTARGKTPSSNPNVPCGISVQGDEVVEDVNYQESFLSAIEDVFDIAKKDAEEEWEKYLSSLKTKVG